MVEGPSHLDEAGRIRMVDVGGKPVTDRSATAEGFVRIEPSTMEAVLGGNVPKGNLIEAARIAGVMAAKRTSDWIPLCHPISLTDLAISIEPDPDRGRIRVEATARAADRTGVEMEAMTAVAAACLTLYDMLKSLERAIEIGPIRLQAKSGGRRGPWTRGSDR